jgi:anion transporter
LIGKTIKTSRFRNIYRANALAIRHRGQLYNTGFSDTPLAAGDAILLEVRQEDHEEIKNNTSFVIVSELDIPKLRKSRIIPALLIVLGIILTATLNILPIVISALIGCILLVITKTITLEEAYRAVDWSVIFLLGGILSLGIALDKTGAALLISDKLIELLGSYGPTAVVAALFLLTLVLTSIMSNNATAVLLAPIAIAAAATMGVNPKPFLMAVAFAASSSFMTPVGYQTNTMIYGVGQYRFADFLKVGTPLSIIFWILAIILIPVFFPF